MYLKLTQANFEMPVLVNTDKVVYMKADETGTEMLFSTDMPYTLCVKESLDEIAQMMSVRVIKRQRSIKCDNCVFHGACELEYTGMSYKCDPVQKEGGRNE